MLGWLGGGVSVCASFAYSHFINSSAEKVPCIQYNLVKTWSLQTV